MINNYTFNKDYKSRFFDRAKIKYIVFQNSINQDLECYPFLFMYDVNNTQIFPKYNNYFMNPNNYNTFTRNAINMKYFDLDFSTSYYCSKCISQHKNYERLMQFTSNNNSFGKTFLHNGMNEFTLELEEETNIKQINMILTGKTNYFKVILKDKNHEILYIKNVCVSIKKTEDCYNSNYIGELTSINID
jgi:hypothetical protein